MQRLLSAAGAVAAALLFSPLPLHAQAPIVLVCTDGTTQPGSSKVSCSDHGGMDWDATKAWSIMRAGHYVTRDTIVCIDGQAKPASTGACKSHGGVDSVSTLASIRRRAKARRFVSPSDSAAAIAPSSQGYSPSTEADTTQPPSKAGAADTGQSMHSDTAMSKSGTPKSKP